jgi:hypothetical protein
MDYDKVISEFDQHIKQSGDEDKYCVYCYKISLDTVE